MSDATKTPTPATKPEEVKVKKARKTPWTISRRFEECVSILKRKSITDEDAKKVETHLSEIQTGINGEQKRLDGLKAQLAEKPRVAKVDRKLVKQAMKKLDELTAEQIQRIIKGDI